MAVVRSVDSYPTSVISKNKKSKSVAKDVVVFRENALDDQLLQIVEFNSRGSSMHSGEFSSAEGSLVSCGSLVSAGAPEVMPFDLEEIEEVARKVKKTEKKEKKAVKRACRVRSSTRAKCALDGVVTQYANRGSYLVKRLDQSGATLSKKLSAESTCTAEGWNLLGTSQPKMLPLGASEIHQELRIFTGTLCAMDLTSQ